MGLLFCPISENNACTEGGKNNDGKTTNRQTKQNKTKQNKTKQNKTKQNKTKQNKTKQNKTKQNKTKQNKTKRRVKLEAYHRKLYLVDNIEIVAVSIGDIRLSRSEM